jgi:hypothetical protein
MDRPAHHTLPQGRDQVRVHEFMNVWNSRHAALCRGERRQQRLGRSHETCPLQCQAQRPCDQHHPKMDLV